MKLTHHEKIALTLVGERNVRLERCSETLRQRLIDLAMKEPPLVDTDGPRVFLTEAGRRALKGSR